MLLPIRHPERPKKREYEDLFSGEEVPLVRDGPAARPQFSVVKSLFLSKRCQALTIR